MSELEALEWYFKEPQNMILADMAEETRKRIGLNKLQMDLVDEVIQKIDNDAAKLMKELHNVYYDVCRDYICTAMIPKNKRKVWYAFSYSVLKRKKTRRHNKVATLWTQLGTDVYGKPALVLHMNLPNQDFIEKMNKNGFQFTKANNDCAEMWGTIVAKNNYLLGIVLLRKNGGAFKTQDEIKQEYKSLLKKKLFFGKNRMIDALADAAS